MQRNFIDLLLGREVERTEFRNRFGWYEGKAITRNDKTSFYSREGWFQGTMRKGDDDEPFGGRR
jgi:hypothetical protein